MNTIDLDALDLSADETPAAPAVPAASEKQVDFARDLYRRIRDLGASDTDLTAYADGVEAAKHDKSLMSMVIDAMLKDVDARSESLDTLPQGPHRHPNGERRVVKYSRSSGKSYALAGDGTYLGRDGLVGLSDETHVDALLDEEPTAPVASDFPTVADGRYALDCGNGIVKFYVVKTPTEGQWAGFTFLDAQASDDLHPVRNVTKKREVLAAIAADPEAAAILYGITLGVCGRCGRTLTDETSRAAGIGPVCADKGW